MRKVDVSASTEWIGESIRAVRRHPLEFLVMGLIFTAIPLVPVFGGIVILLLGPALLGGMIFAAREAAHGNKPQIGQLFQAFSEGDRIGSLIALSLPMFAALILMVIAAMPVILAVIHSGAVNQDTLHDQAALMTALRPVIAPMVGRLLLMFVLFIVILFVAGMLTFLASACVMLGRQPAFTAMRASFAACMRNFGAYFVTVLLLGLGLGIARLVLTLLLPDLLAVLLTSVPYYAILGPLTYAAYRSIFGDADAGEGGASPDQPPPPPQHTFEA